MTPKDRVFICINQEYYIYDSKNVMNRERPGVQVLLVTGFQY